MKEPSTKDTWLHGLITYYIIFYTVYAGQSWVSAVPFIKVQLHVKQCSPHPYTVSLPISIGQQAKLCLPRVLAEPWFTFKTSVLFCCFQPLEYWRFESGATRSACDQMHQWGMIFCKSWWKRSFWGQPSKFQICPPNDYHFASCHREPRRLFTLCFWPTSKFQEKKPPPKRLFTT